MKKLKSAICLAIFLTATGLSAQDLGSEDCVLTQPGGLILDGYCLYDQSGPGGYYCDQFFTGMYPPDCVAYLIVT